jgi:hypothetical protein
MVTQKIRGPGLKLLDPLVVTQSSMPGSAKKGGYANIGMFQ